jgi:hypothetical protein
VAEKISALRTEEFVLERGAHSSLAKARKLLQWAGNEPPRDGDELP